MKAAVLHEPGPLLPVEEVDLEAPKHGEVLVDMVGAGVCHSDYHMLSGKLNLPMPLVMGHEGAGIVSETGPGVTGFSPGDKVIFSMDKMCGQCRNCTIGSPTLCLTYGRIFTMGDGTTRFSGKGGDYYHMVGTFSEQSVVPADQLVKVRDDTPLEKASIIGCAVITGVGSVVNRAKVEKGSSVAVFGCGGVGLNVVQGAVLAGATRIIAVDTVPFKLAKSEELGATHLVNAAREDPVKRVVEITGGGADYAFEVVGLPHLVRQAFESVRTGGVAVMVGVQPPGAEIAVDANQLMMQRSLVGAYHGDARARVDFPWLVDLYMDGRLKLDELITRYRPLDEVNEGFADMNAGITARTVLTFD